MSENKKAKIEALLFATHGLTSEQIAKKLGLNIAEVETLLQELELEYLKGERGVQVVKDGEIWRMDIKPNLTLHVKDLLPPELPNSLLKTLAIIAVHHPIKQSIVVKIRGNKAYDHIKKLLRKGFIITEKKGNTLLIDLTQKFFDYFRVDESILDKVKKEKSFYLKT